MVNLQWDNDGVTVKVKGKDSTTDTIIFENMSSMGYKNSQTVLDGIRSGAITQVNQNLPESLSLI